MNYGGGQTTYISDLEAFAKEKGWLTERVATGNVKAPVYGDMLGNVVGGLPKGATFPAKSTQVGGNHYKDMPIQPADFIIQNKIGWAEGCAIAYLSRWRQKGGVEDLKKARHTIDLLIEQEEAKA